MSPQTTPAELPVGHLGFGAMRITGQGIWGPPKDESEAIALLRRVVDRGVTFIDTAEYSEGSAKPVQQAIENARAKRVEADLDKFLANRFGKSMVPAIKAIHETEEGRPIDARSQDARGLSGAGRQHRGTGRRHALLPPAPIHSRAARQGLRSRRSRQE